MNYGRVSDIVREEIRSDYVPNACILAARVATLALREFGVQAEAVAVELDAFSPAYMRMVEYGRSLGRELTQEEVGRFAAEGAWRMSVTAEPARPGVLDHRSPNGYQGHVVVIAEDRRWLLDPTLAQINRPQKGLVVEPPFVHRIMPDDWNDGHLGVRTGTGVVVAYRLTPGRRDFTKAPDWRSRREPARRATFERVLGRIVQRIEKEARSE
jgi:hypothetical protein